MDGHAADKCGPWERLHSDHIAKEKRWICGISQSRYTPTYGVMTELSANNKASYLLAELHPHDLHNDTFIAMEGTFCKSLHTTGGAFVSA